MGLLLSFISMLGSWLGVLPPNPVASVINMVEHAGLVFIGAGLVTWGVVALRARALGRLSLVPLLVGLLSLRRALDRRPGRFHNGRTERVSTGLFRELGRARIRPPDDTDRGSAGTGADHGRVNQRPNQGGALAVARAPVAYGG